MAKNEIVISEEPLIDVAERKKFMFYINKQGYLAKTPYVNRKLSDDERAKREVAAELRSEAFVKRVAANKAKREQKKADRVIALKKKLSELQA